MEGLIFGILQYVLYFNFYILMNTGHVTLLEKAYYLI